MAMGNGHSGRTVLGRALLAILAAAAVSMPSAARAARVRLLVQKRYIRLTPGLTSVPLGFRRPNVVGDLIVAYVVWDNAGAVTLSDTGGNTYATAIGPTAEGGGTGRAQVLYAANVTGGTNTVTATFATPVGAHAALYLHEYKGMDRTSPLDAAVAASGTGMAVDTGMVTASRPNDLLFAAASSNGKVINHLTRGFKARARKYGNVTADETVVAPGSYG